MKIVVTVRCYNETPNIIHRFFQGYWFADKIIISDGGSDKSETLITLLDYQSQYPEKVKLIHFDEYVIKNGERFNPDNPHIQYVIDAGKAENPDWLIFDDMDDIPNKPLQLIARDLLAESPKPEVQLFRLYMWGDTHFFPKMNDYFNPNYTSLWAWKPSERQIGADLSQWHGTIIGVTVEHHKILPPYCLLHKSWNPETIDAKIKRYAAVGIEMVHPTDRRLGGRPEVLPEWAHD